MSKQVSHTRASTPALVGSFVPTIALLIFGYTIPVISTLIWSFEDAKGQWVGLQNYLDVFTSYYFLDSLLYTIKVSLISTAAAMLIAVVCALALRETFVGKKLVVLMFQLNMTIPRMAAAMMLTLLLAQTGVVAQLCYALGWISSASEFPWFVKDSEGVGLIAAFTWKFFPYIGMSVLGVLQGASRDYEYQAAVLGVGPIKRFFHVTLPLIVPATSIASIIVFAAAFGDYELPTILGGNAHRMLSVYTYQKYTDAALMDKPEAYVLMMVMCVLLMAIILLYRRLTMREGATR